MRHCATISAAKHNQNDKCLDIEPETEALILVVLENNWSRWKALHECKSENKVAMGSKQVETLERHNPSHDKNEDKKHCIHIKNDPKLATKWTESNSGQKKFGGWSDEGIICCKSAVEIVQKKRSMEEGMKWEADVLALMHEEHGIEANAWKEERKRRGKAARKLDDDDGDVEIVSGVISDGEAESDDELDAVEVQQWFAFGEHGALTVVNLVQVDFKKRCFQSKCGNF